MSCRRRCRHLQGRIFLSLSRGPHASREPYAFGNIDLWARLASNAPGLANLTTQLPFLRDIAKLVAGIPQPAQHPRLRAANLPPLVPNARRPREPDGAHQSCSGRTPSTTTSFQRPRKAAVEVLEAAGFRVILPPRTSLLRTSALRLRHVGSRQATAARDPRRPRRRDRSRNSARRPRTKLRHRLPRRVARTLSQRSASPPPCPANLPP